MNLGVELRVYRKSKGHSVKKVAELTGIPVDRIYKWEKGTRPSDAEDLLKIREYMTGKVENKPAEMESLPIKGDTVNFRHASEQEYQEAYKKVLTGYVTLQDHIDVLKMWRADAESKYQDSHAANMKLLELLNTKIAEIETNLKTGQHQIQEQIFVSTDALAQQLEGISAGLAAQEVSKKDTNVSGKHKSSDGKGKAR